MITKTITIQKYIKYPKKLTNMKSILQTDIENHYITIPFLRSWAYDRFQKAIAYRPDPPGTSKTGRVTLLKGRWFISHSELLNPSQVIVSLHFKAFRYSVAIALEYRRAMKRGKKLRWHELTRANIYLLTSNNRNTRKIY